MKKVILGIVLSLFSLGLVGCSSNNESISEESSSSYDLDKEFDKAKQNVADENTIGSNNEDIDSEVSESHASATIGQSQPLTSDSGDMIDVKIDSVEKDPGDGDYYTPENGYYAKVTYTVSNLGDDPFDVNSHALDFYDGENMKATLNSRDFYSETIQPGKSATGVAYFDIKNDTPDYEVYYSNASWKGSY